ncbi:MAG: hypothetical protein EKK33_36285 [Bradyrhizobiaceae bacterium]|nr:MAG: hypothetical protein EKK33_36285 [Bradyrhizobiaceae bacterium]
MELGRRHDIAALPLAGEGWGEGCLCVGTVWGQRVKSPRRDSPHPALRADLSRKRERLHGAPRKRVGYAACRNGAQAKSG